MTRRRTEGGRVYYERGVAMRFGYPSLLAPQATLEFLRNPLYGTAHEMESLPQGIVQTPTGRSVAASIASGVVRTNPYRWGHMPEGFPQAQRLTGEATVQCDTPITLSLASEELLVSIGFRSFDGTEPARVQCIELDAVGSHLVTHDFAFTPAALRQHPSGALTQLDLEFTADAACAILRIEAESSGQDFCVTDLVALGPDGNAYGAVGAESVNAEAMVLDEDADGLGNGWSLAAGDLENCRWHGQDAAGLRQWIRSVSKGALRTFEMQRPGDGVIRTYRLVRDVSAIGWPHETAGVVSGVDIGLEEIVA